MPTHQNIRTLSAQVSDLKRGTDLEQTAEKSVRSPPDIRDLSAIQLKNNLLLLSDTCPAPILFNKRGIIHLLKCNIK